MNDNISQTELSDWVKLYANDLYKWAYNKTSDDQLSEDLVQETFLVAAENPAAFKKNSQPKTWLYGILKNKIADHYRKAIRQNISMGLPEDDTSAYFRDSGRWKNNARPQPWDDEPEHLTDMPAFNTVFNSCIEHLPTTMNACIRLKFLDEKKGAQVCQELGLTTTNYWQLIHRAKLQLRDCLEKHWFLKHV